MVCALSNRVVVAVGLALVTLSGTLYAQVPLPPLAGGGISERVSPEDVERADRRRDREQVVVQLRELHARGEYMEMLSTIQEAEKTMPNDMVLKQYGYMAQKGINDIERVDEPIISANSPALRLGNFPQPQAGSGGLGNPATGVSEGGLGNVPSPAGLPPLSAGADPLPAGVPGLPSLPEAEGTGVPAVPSTTTSEGDGGVGASAATAEDPVQDGSQAQVSTMSPKRLALIGAGILLGLVGLFTLLRRRRNASYEVPVKTRRFGAPVAGTSVPPPIPGAAAFPAYATQRDALTEVDASEEEVARDIAQNIGTRTPASPGTFAPAFDMFIPDGKADMPTNFHEGLPTMVDEEHIQDQPTMPFLTDFNDGQPESPAPVVPNFVSFADLGISFADEKDAAPPAAPMPVPSPAPSLSKSDPTPAELPPLEISGLSTAETAPQSKRDEVDASAETHRLPALLTADELIRLDDPNLISPPTGLPDPVPAEPQAPKNTTADDRLPGTVDLSELLFSQQQVEEEVKGGVVEQNAHPPVTFDTISLTDETLPGTPAFQQSPVAETFKGGPDDRISLDLFDSSEALPSPAPVKSADSDFHDEETIMIPVLNERAGPVGTGSGHPDDSLSATAGLTTESAPPKAADEQSYYAASPKGEASLDERSEKMFREQRDRADKAVAESNWKQAVHYLSIAAAIRPDDDEVVERLRQAREQKRRQEASV